MLYVILKHNNDEPREDYRNVVKVEVRDRYTYLTLDNGEEIIVDTYYTRIDIEVAK